MDRMVQFDEPNLMRQLARMSCRDRTAFALACAKRLDPLLGEISPEDRAIVRSCRELLERAISGQSMAQGQVSLASAQLESLETLDFDAVASVAFAMRAWLSDSPQDAMWAARRAYEAQDEIAQREIGGSGFDEPRLLAHPAVQEELRAQLVDMDALLKGERGA
jgi:hypothetical protein